MIVIISDLHLQHTALDGIRREEDGRVLETRIVRNVNAQALALLLAEVIANAERTGSKQIHFVFAGDIFELHRTPLWLLGGEMLRPTLHPASASAELERKVLGLLDAIAQENHEFFAALADFAGAGVTTHRGTERALVGVAICIHYLPGNHDRLTGAWPSTRRRVRELLCMTPPAGGPSAPFEHQLEWSRADGYGVLVRHGHEYDPMNFGEAFDPAKPASAEAYDKPTLGDFVTVDIATRLAVAFRAHYARELRQSGRDGDRFRRIYTALTEFDDVRPQSKLVSYLTHVVGVAETQAFSILRPVLRDAFETAKADSFFISEAKRLELAKYFSGPLGEAIDAALKNLSANHIARLLALFERYEQTSAGGPADFAMKERGIASGDVTVVVAGHTHEPHHVAIPGIAPTHGQGTEAYFLDSGTWRTRIDSGVGGAFGRLRGYTMVFCYHDDELRQGERRRFETWTGHLQAEDYGPVFAEDVTPAERPPVHAVRFVECRVRHVDEGETHDGAELVLYFGVDGAARKAAFDGVHDGDVLALPGDAVVSADPALDGEAWCYGVERDLGDSILDRDDPMPWAVRFLPRTADDRNAPFTAGRSELYAADNRGNALTLVLEVN